MIRLHVADGNDADMFYIVRTRIPDPFFMLDTGRKKYVFLNALELDAFKEKKRPVTALPIEPYIKKARQLKTKGSMAGKIAYLLLGKFKLQKKKIAVPRTLPLDVADYLRSRGVDIVISNPFLPERRIKSAEEIAYVRNSLRALTSGFRLIEKILRVSVIQGNRVLFRGRTLTSEYIKREVEKVLFEKGMEDIEGMILSCGRHAAMPHHKGNGTILPHSTIVCDLFFRHKGSGFFGDMTRTYVKGAPNTRLLAMYNAVAAAQDESFRFIKAGRKAKDAYKKSADAIKQAGFDVGEKGYVHSLGHGLGIELHEGPNVGPHSKDVLKAGNIITIEPGLYYPHIGGVRLEDVVVVTKRGYRNLTRYPRRFIIP